MFRVLLWLIGLIVVVGGLGYLGYAVLTNYGDDPFTLMVFAIPIVAMLAFMLQVMRR